jgi:hypothetical protein
MQPNSVRQFIEAVDRIKGMSLESAVIVAMGRYPRLAADVMDRIGSWPSETPELRVLQKYWP